MNITYISPLRDLEDEIKPLFSNEFMMAFFKYFCDVVKSRLWGYKKAKNAKYGIEDFLRVFFYAEITGRSVHSASERLNRLFKSEKKGSPKTYEDGRGKGGPAPNPSK